MLFTVIRIIYFENVIVTESTTTDFAYSNFKLFLLSAEPHESSFEGTSKKISDRIYELDSGKIIDETEVRREIVSLLQEKHNLIDDAIRQGGRIICINGTQTYAGYLLNRWSSDSPETSLNADKALSASFNLLTKEKSISLLIDEHKFLPLIFGASAIDINYRFSKMSFKVPIRLTLNDKSLDKIEII